MTDKEIIFYIKSFLVGLVIIGPVFWGNLFLKNNLFPGSCGLTWIIMVLGAYTEIALGLILTGYIAAVLCCNCTISRKQLITTCAGICAIIGFVLILFIPYPSILNINMIPAYVVLFLVTPAVWGASGAVIFLRGTGTQDPDNNIPEKTECGEKKSRNTRIILTIVSLIVLCIPFSVLLGFFAIVSGMDDGRGCTGGSIFTYGASMHAARSDNSTVILTFNLDAGDSLFKYYPVQPRYLQIAVDGRDFSNQSIIRQQGLTDTIIPPEGMVEYRNGASVILTGPDIARNGSTGCHIKVMSYYDQNSPRGFEFTDV